MEIIVMMVISVLVAVGTTMITCHWIMGQLAELIYKEMEKDGKNAIARDAGLAINIDANTRNIHAIAKALNIDKYTEKRQEKASDAINLTAEDTESDDWPTASIRDADAEIGEAHAK